MCMKKRVQWVADRRGRAYVYEKASTMERRRARTSIRVWKNEYSGSQTDADEHTCMKKRVQWVADRKRQANVYEKASTMGRSFQTPPTNSPGYSTPQLTLV
ncbi:hypothetical protein PAT3040_06767 [Paenibacillus agaridevorans]|uniref:Uncharacterized protein n=1 Tax=Paenibacillus agaridevorans TaxID=171404 RepID=A0A2R5F638_9BACL|nr:hypothetical protein PAT3040_06767 [Paenibacillus agaridevorans]